MIPSLTIEALRARAVTRLTLAATVASLLVSLLYASLHLRVELRGSLTLGALFITAIAALPVACGGGWVMRRAAQQRSRRALSGGSTIGCVLLVLVTAMSVAATPHTAHECRWRQADLRRPHRECGVRRAHGPRVRRPLLVCARARHEAPPTARAGHARGRFDHQRPHAHVRHDRGLGFGFVLQREARLLA